MTWLSEVKKLQSFSTPRDHYSINSQVSFVIMKSCVAPVKGEVRNIAETRIDGICLGGTDGPIFLERVG